MGIRRVVVNIIRRSTLLSSHTRIKCIPVIAKKGVFTELTPSELKDFICDDTTNVSRSTKAIGNSLEFPRISSVFLKAAGRLFEFLKLFRILKHWESGSTGPQEGDLLILPDAFWGQNEQYLNAVQNTHRRGTELVLVLHDLIPFRNPEFYEEVFVNNFQTRTRQILPLLHGIIGVSQSVMEDIRLFLNEHPEIVPIPPRLDYFYLGSDFKKNGSSLSDIRPDIRSLAESHPLLYVGTIEPRKDPTTRWRIQPYSREQ